MKRTITIAALLAVTAVFFFACDNPLGLGARLDLDGPLLEVSSPVPRMAFSRPFSLEGSVSDRSSVERILITASLDSKISGTREVFAKQWQYKKNAGWQVSEDSGSTWSNYTDASTDGSANTFSWAVIIDMSIQGMAAEDGEYMFTVQSWDAGGMSDDKSIKTRVFIFDNDPPRVMIFNPYLYSRHSGYDRNTDTFNALTDEAQELQRLHALPAGGDGWRDVNLLGKFLTQEFQLQWQIEEDYDIWSVDIRFYDQKAVIDGDPETDLPGGYFYHYFQNLPPPEPDPSRAIKPNGNILVPSLTSSVGTYSGAYSGEIMKSVTEKTTIQVVALCYDAAGHVNNEKTIGYFIFWPEAAAPWIEFSDGMKEPGEHTENDPKDFEAHAFMIYPGRNIRATAFQAQGVSRVEYSLHRFNVNIDGDNTIGDALSLAFMELRPVPIQFVEGSNKQKVVVRNSPRPNGSFSTIFQWDFMPEARSNFYVVRAQAFDFTGTPGAVYEAVFRVQDITFPDFPVPPNPSAGEPLFKFIGRPEANQSDIEYTLPSGNIPSNSIRISGIAADATEIQSIYIAWINPQSISYSAMSQLSYFRDANYKGWLTAVGSAEDGNKNNVIPDGGFVFEGLFDSEHPNKVWKVQTTPIGEDYDTQRMRFRYELTIDVTALLNIGGNGSAYVTDSLGNTIEEKNDMPLSSQVFLIRAENPDSKATIITYAPQGDTSVPTMSITSVQIDGETFYPSDGFTQLKKFSDAGGETIIVNGTWIEDSTEYLNSDTYFYNNMKFSINRETFTRAGDSGITVNITPPGSDSAANGTFTITARVGAAYALKTSELRDTLVVSASVHDIGGNPAETGASWLIESDTLRFLRVSSEDDDHAYRATGNDKGRIRIFFEFNKPVVLRRGSGQNPVLLLNVEGGTRIQRAAVYDTSQSSENTRHFFDYDVVAGQNTPTANTVANQQNLNVTGISINGGTTEDGLAGNSTVWQNENYSFTFTHTKIDGTQEEVRLTMNPAHTDAFSRVRVESLSTNTKNVYARSVPVNPVRPPTGNNTANPDFVFTLAGGKAITVDNTAPFIQSVSATPPGWHKEGTEIFITATFNKTVKIDTETAVRIPYLVLNASSNSTTNRTSTTPADIRVNGNQISFKYTVQAGDNTIANTSPNEVASNDHMLRITGFGGVVYDIPENEMTSLGATRLVENVRIDTTTPSPLPTIAVYSGTNGTGTLLPTSTGTIGNVYNDNVFVRFTGQSGVANMGRVEYTLNNGTNWTTYDNINGVTNVQLNNNGEFTIRARQIDRAGNETAYTGNTTLNLDRGGLITSITSTTPNGDYTNNSNRQDKVSIQVNFRKALTFPAGMTLTLNAVTTVGGNTSATTEPLTVSGATNQLTFTYNVGAGHNVPANANLNVTAHSFTSGVTDNGSGVPSTALALPAAANNLGTLKAIKIVTGGLTVSGTPTFTGTRQADDSVNAAITVTFSRSILRGSGELTVIQRQSDFRLPAVLTEAQRNRVRSTIGTEAFDSYYSRGTNGIAGSASTSVSALIDTSPKYILRFNQDPAAITAVTPADGVTQTTLISTPGQFADVYRRAEGIKLLATSSAVAVSGSTLTITLSGSNALQVPGATYEVNIPAGFVQDALSNNSPAVGINTTIAGGSNHTIAAFGGVAKPFIRIFKEQETLTINTSTSTTVPLVSASYPMQARIRMNTRTPGATIRYNNNTDNADNATTNVTGDNWYVINSDNNYTLGPRDSAAAPARPTAPTNSTGTVFSATFQVPQTAGNISNAQGYIWRVRAVAFNSGGTASAESEEMAMRTVLTYHIQDMANPGDLTAGEQRIATGQQIWLRGGDAIGSSSVPGFPLTWADDFTKMASDKTRAGIRLMSLTATPASSFYTNSTWRWVTWEVNVDTYFDIILGANAGASANDDTNRNRLLQHGPLQFAYQRAGWTSYKESYRLYPGKHRWISTNSPVNVNQGLLGYGDIQINGVQMKGKGSVNYSATWSYRPAMTGTNDVTYVAPTQN